MTVDTIPFPTQRISEFGEYRTALGSRGWRVTVDIYKNKWSAALRREWDGINRQPQSHFNAPYNLSDARIKELTVETRRRKINKETNKPEGWAWHRPSGAKNELWDLLMYNSAALDMIAYDEMVTTRENEDVDWNAFFDSALTDALYYDRV